MIPLAFRCASAALAVASERRVALIAAVAAGFGRVISEVGISMMVGGNIRGDTRNITTGIAFETGKRIEFEIPAKYSNVLRWLKDVEGRPSAKA